MYYTFLKYFLNVLKAKNFTYLTSDSLLKSSIKFYNLNFVKKDYFYDSQTKK